MEAATGRDQAECASQRVPVSAMQQAVLHVRSTHPALVDHRALEAKGYVMSELPAGSTVDCHIVMRRVKRQLVGAAQDAYPREACGIITFGGQVWTARNVNEFISGFVQPTDRQRMDFVMNPEDVMVMWPHAAAIWHTHPNGRLDPSTVDKHWHPTRGATGQPLGMVIVTCEDAVVAVPWGLD
jgi:proteasome lid subunit RPN8/RPN11